LATIFVAFFLATPAFAAGDVIGVFSVSPSIAPISMPHGSDVLSSIYEVIQAPRGGGIGMGISKRSKGSLYLKALNDEVLWLEQQLRRVEQEQMSLKKKLSNRQQIREGVTLSKGKKKQGKGKSTLEKHEEDVLRLANLEQLEKQKESLLTTKAQLESIKMDYDQKLQALQSDLLKSTSRNTNIEKTFLARVKELENSLKKVREAASNPKVNNDPDLSRKIEEACQVAIADFWVEGNRKLQEHERQLKASHERDVMEERRLATIAVDKQRQKMRALARATAIREKEIAARTKLLSRQQSQTTQQRNRGEKLEREKIKSLREEAERKAKEEEERMWLELESELDQERERLQRMKQREEEEKRRCEQEELERRRLLQQHALDLEARLRKEQQQAATGDFRGSTGPSLFGRLFGSRKKTFVRPEPTVASIENYQRRVMWQPISLPPKEAIQITGPNQSQ